MTVESVLDKALEGRELSAQDGEALFAAEGDNLRRLLSAADDLRRRRVGERVAYVVNRNVNFTNICVKRCGFCAFSRGHRAEQGYFLPTEDIFGVYTKRGISALPKSAFRRGSRRAWTGPITSIFALLSREKSPRFTCTRFRRRRFSTARHCLTRSIEDYLEGSPGRGPRVFAGHFGRDSGRSRPRHHLSWPASPLATGSRVIAHGPQSWHPDQPPPSCMQAHRDRSRPGPAPGAAARHSKGNRRHHGVCSAQFHRHRSAHGEEIASAWRPYGRHSRRYIAHIRGRPPHAGPVDSQHSSHVGEARPAPRSGVPAGWRERFRRNLDE